MEKEIANELPAMEEETADSMEKDLFTGSAAVQPEFDFEKKKERLKKLIEAALFLAPGTVSLNELSKVARASLPEVRISLNELIHDYSERNGALEIVSTEQGYRIAVKGEFEPQVSHFASSPEIHKGILKTLSLIAFKQPVKQSEIIKLRNSKAYEHIKILKEKGFIKKEKKGITSILTTTKKFIDYFGESVKQKQLRGKSMQNAEEMLKELKQKMPVKELKKDSWEEMEAWNKEGGIEKDEFEKEKPFPDEEGAKSDF